MTTRILILGGTTEARLFAHAIADRADLDIAISLAGRTRNPVAQPVPVRSGGFGGVTGMRDFLMAKKIDIVVDATHPFAQNISANASKAAMLAGIEFFVIRRPAWKPVEGDKWRDVTTVTDAIRLAGVPRRHIFMAIGRQEIMPIWQAPQHHYLIRSVDPIEPPLELPNITYILARGPFEESSEVELFKRHKIDLVIAKNSGGSASYAKLAAARRLEVPVMLIRRPPMKMGLVAPDVESGVQMLDHLLRPRLERGE